MWGIVQGLKETHIPLLKILIGGVTPMLVRAIRATKVWLAKSKL